MSRALTILIAALLSPSAFAKIYVGKDVSVKTGMPVWVAEFKRQARNQKDPLVECRRTLELDGLILCGFSQSKNMNRALARSSSYIEGFEGTQGVLKNSDDRSLGQSLETMAGHDLKSDNLVRFYDAVVEACKSNNGKCMNAYEKELFAELILPEAQKQDFVIITYSTTGAMAWGDVVTHEILHAQYFLQAAYSQAIDDYWVNEVSSSDKKRVKTILGHYYNRADNLLMKNEFQAYILMPNADRSYLATLVPRHRRVLVRKLESAGVPPLQVKTK